MPETSLSFLHTLNQERLEESSDDIKQERFPREAAFLKTAELLATHEKIQESVIDIVVGDVEDDIKLMGIYVVLISDNESLKLDLFNTLYPEESPALMDIDLVVSMLPETQHQNILNILVGIKHNDAYKVVASQCLIRGSGERYIKMMLDVDGQPLFSGSVFDSFYAQFGTEEIIHNLVKFFESKTDVETKLPLAKSLLKSKNDSAAQWLCGEEAILADKCETFAILSELDDRTKQSRLLELLNTPDTGEDLLLEIVDNLKWYGNPYIQGVLYHALRNNHNVKVVAAFHRLMLNFYDLDNEPLFEGLVLLSEEEQNKDNYVGKVKAFWDKRSEYAEKELSKQRYFYNEAFDLQAIAQQHLDLSTHVLDLTKLISAMSLWSGLFLKFDEQALLSKQVKQLTEIQQTLEAQELEVGSWYRFGRKLD